MKFLLLFILIIISNFCHSQIIDQHVIPFPRRVNDVKLVIQTHFPNSTSSDSSNIVVDTIFHKVLINSYYTNGGWPTTCVLIDTFDLSNILEPAYYELKFFSNLNIYDTLLVDSITHRISIEPSLFVNNEYINEKCNIFPNPTTTSINVIVYSKNQLKNVYFKLFNYQGKLVKAIEKKQINSDEVTTIISLQDLLSGMYILQIKIGNNYIYRKIIKN
jgi:hypothetical protein